MDIKTTPYCEIQGVSFDVALLPWGATEPHNLHLPYGTDILIPERLANEASARAFEKFGVRSAVLPAIPLGSQNPGQRQIPFCIHARYETQKAILTDIVESLNAQNIEQLIIVNGHGGNNFRNMLRDLAIDFPNFTIVVNDWYSMVPQGDFFENPDDHAGEMESSVMLHYHPNLINMSQAGEGASITFALNSLRDKTGWLPRDWSKVSRDTGIGDPRLASAEKGGRCAEWVVQKLTTLIHELTTKKLY